MSISWSFSLPFILYLINPTLSDEKQLCEQAWMKSNTYKQATNDFDDITTNGYKKRFMHICYQYCKFESGLPRLQTSTGDVGVTYKKIKKDMRNQYKTEKYNDILAQHDSWSNEEQKLFDTDPETVIEAKIDAIFAQWWESKLVTEAQADKCWIFEIVADSYVMSDTQNNNRTDPIKREQIYELFEVELFPLFVESITEVLKSEYNRNSETDARRLQIIGYLKTLRTAMNDKYYQWTQPWIYTLSQLYADLYFSQENKALESEKQKLENILPVFEKEITKVIPKFVFTKYGVYMERAMNRFKKNFQKWITNYDFIFEPTSHKTSNSREHIRLIQK